MAWNLASALLAVAICVQLFLAARADDCALLLDFMNSLCNGPDVLGWERARTAACGSASPAAGPRRTSHECKCCRVSAVLPGRSWLPHTGSVTCTTAPGATGCWARRVGPGSAYL